MQNKDFKIYNKVANYVLYVRKNLVVNIPKVHNDLRIHLQDESYNLLRTLYETAYTKGNIRNKNITELLIILSMLDFLTSSLKELNCINKRNLEVSIGMLTEIKNMIYAWRKTIENNDKKEN